MNRQMTTDWQTTVEDHRKTLLNRLLLAALVGGFAAIVVEYFSKRPEAASTTALMAEILPYIVSWLIALVACLWRGLDHRIRSAIPILLAYGLGVLTFFNSGLPGSGRTYMLLVPVLAFVLQGAKSGILSGLLGLLTYLAFTLLFGLDRLEPQVDTLALSPNGLTTWTSEGASFLLVGAIATLLLWSFSRSWLQALADVTTSNVELENTNEQLHRQASQLQATTDIARVGSTTLDPDSLMAEVVSRIQTRFSLMGVYFVGLFMINESKQAAVLKAATGEAGKLLKEMRYQARVDDDTSISQAFVRQEAIIAHDVGGTVQLGSVPMPNTRSEIALPMRSRGRTLGVLNAHSTHEMAFTEEDLDVLQTMADQVAVAVDNAQLFSQTEAALQDVQSAQQSYISQAWSEFLAHEPTTTIDYAETGVEVGDGAFLSEAQQAAREHRRTVVKDSGPTQVDGEDAPSQSVLAVPLKLRGQIIGTITLHETRRKRMWTPEDIGLAEAIAEQATLTVENLRLLETTQRRAARERAIRDISDRMQQATDMETLMNITANELKRALHGSRVYVRLGTETPSPGDNGGAGEGDN